MSSPTAAIAARAAARLADLDGWDLTTSPPNGRGSTMPFVRPEPWVARGACYGAGTAKFFNEQGKNTTEAKLICNGCPVRDDCLEYALRTSQRYGVWGGTVERERRWMRAEIRRRRRQQVA